jgi:hypothetical protein
MSLCSVAFTVLFLAVAPHLPEEKNKKTPGYFVTFVLNVLK